MERKKKIFFILRSTQKLYTQFVHFKKYIKLLTFL